MKKYIVEYFVDNAAQYAGSEPHDTSSEIFDRGPVEADSPAEAISIAMDIMVEDIVNNTGGTSLIDIVRDDDLTVLYDGEVDVQFYGFSASEIEEDEG